MKSLLLSLLLLACPLAVFGTGALPVVIDPATGNMVQGPTSSGFTGVRVPSGYTMEFLSGATLKLDAGSTVLGFLVSPGTSTAGGLAYFTDTGGNLLVSSTWHFVGSNTLQTSGGAQIQDNGTGAVTMIANGASAGFTFQTQSGGTVVLKVGTTSVFTMAGGGLTLNQYSTAGPLVVSGAGAVTSIAKGSDGTFLGVSSGTLGFLTPSGGGNVSNVGTPTNGQIGQWTGSTTLQGIGTTGSGNVVLVTSPTLVTPVLGVAGGTSLNLSSTLAVGGVETLSAALVQLNAFSVINELGQDSSHYLYFEWAYNATPSAANAQIGTFGQNNPFLFVASGYTFNTTNLASALVVGGNGDVTAGGGSDTGAPLGVNGNFIATGTITEAGVPVFGGGGSVANGAIATALSSIGPTGSHTTVQKWLKWSDGSGTYYSPGF